MKTFRFKRRTVVTLATFLAISVTGFAIFFMPRPLPPRPTDVCRDIHSLEMMVRDMEDHMHDASYSDVSVLLGGVISRQQPSQKLFDQAERIAPDSDLMLRLRPQSTVQIVRPLTGPNMKGTLELLDGDADYTPNGPAGSPPRLGEYVLVQYELSSEHVSFMMYVPDRASPKITAIERYKQWVSMADHSSAITQATQVMCDPAQDALFRLTAFYAIRWQLQKLTPERNAHASAVATAFRRTELELLTSPDLPEGLTMALMENILWMPDSVTDTERDRVTHYLIAVVTRNRTRWKVCCAFDALRRIIECNDLNNPRISTPEILQALEQRTSSEVAGKSLYSGVAFSYSTPYVPSTDRETFHLSDQLSIIKSVMLDSLSSHAQQKSITHKLAPMPNDDLMRRLLAAAER